MLADSRERPTSSSGRRVFLILTLLFVCFKNKRLSYVDDVALPSHTLSFLNIALRLLEEQKKGVKYGNICTLFICKRNDMLRNNRKELTMYDHGYSKAVQEYERQLERGFEPCEPEVVRAEKEYEPDGYSTVLIYNCEECDNQECENWKEYNQ